MPVTRPGVLRNTRSARVESELLAVLEHHEVETITQASQLTLPRGTSHAQLAAAWGVYHLNCGRGWN